MLVNGIPYRTIWLDDTKIKIIDQRWLPHKFIVEEITTVDEMCIAIKDMHLRGAGIIGVAACFAVYLAVCEAAEKNNFSECLKNSVSKILNTRPTAVNLQWGVKKSLEEIEKVNCIEEKINIAKKHALQIAEDETETCRLIGNYGLQIIEGMSKKKQGETLNILTHCNAGWLAFVDYGSALSPVYFAHKNGIKVHVWVDETRPRNQGASLTAWELGMEGVPHTLIADNTGGLLMQQGKVDMVIVGTDRTTLNGNVVNKIGTYLKALAAFDNNIPFYVALPLSSIDLYGDNNSLPIETRSEDEVLYVQGMNEHHEISKVRIAPQNTKALNYGFDITPARLITKLITEKGIINADNESIRKLLDM